MEITKLLDPMYSEKSEVGNNLANSGRFFSSVFFLASRNRICNKTTIIILHISYPFIFNSVQKNKSHNTIH